MQCISTHTHARTHARTHTHTHTHTHAHTQKMQWQRAVFRPHYLWQQKRLSAPTPHSQNMNIITNKDELPHSIRQWTHRASKLSVPLKNPNQTAHYKRTLNKSNNRCREWKWAEELHSKCCMSHFRFEQKRSLLPRWRETDGIVGKWSNSHLYCSLKIKHEEIKF